MNRVMIAIAAVVLAPSVVMAQASQINAPVGGGSIYPKGSIPINVQIWTPANSTDAQWMDVNMYYIQNGVAVKVAVTNFAMTSLVATSIKPLAGVITLSAFIGTVSANNPTPTNPISEVFLQFTFFDAEGNQLEPGSSYVLYSQAFQIK